MGEGRTHRSDSGTAQNVILASRQSPPWREGVDAKEKPHASSKIRRKFPSFSLKLDG